MNQPAVAMPDSDDAGMKTGDSRRWLRRTIVAVVLLFALWAGATGFPNLWHALRPRTAWSRNQDVRVTDEQAAEPNSLFVIQDDRITESSGLAISRVMKDHIWTHNDSGDEPRLFLVGPDGQTRVMVTVKDQQPRDWEDMCSFDFDGTSWLLVADVGDNAHARGRSDVPCRLLLLRSPEEQFVNDAKLRELTITAAAEITFDYADGPVNCESVAVDPFAKEILLVTKTDPLSCRLYRLPLSFETPEKPLSATAIASPGIPFATGMDITPDGRAMVITTMFNAALIRRSESESWTDALKKSATVFEVPPQPQCEAICFTADGRSVLLTSEFSGQEVWKVSLEGK